MGTTTATQFKDHVLEAVACDAIDLREAEALLARFSTLVRESGSRDERAAAEYIGERLTAFGIPFEMHEPSLYLSIPQESRLRVIGPEGRTIGSRPPAFARSTGGEAVVGDVIHVPAPRASGDDPIAGKIVLTDGFSMRGPVDTFERRGAIAQIYIHPGEDIHEGICTTIWGAPTAESIARKPATPIICVNRADGDALVAQAAAGTLRVSISTWLKEGWAPCLLPIAEIRGQQDPDEFLLVHGHYDSWYEGIGDNATGDAALLELARVLHGLRDRLKRSVRIAWWPGHSTGRYAGSTWYADTFADELDERCLAHLNVDSPGCAGATAYDEVTWMAEAGALCTEAIGDAIGVVAGGIRPTRAGDYSFSQIGATAFYMLMSNIPPAERAARGFYPVNGCGGNIAWHTVHDLLPVADLEILRRDLQVYLTTILRVVNAPLHPFDYAATIDEIAAAVAQYQRVAGVEIDLQPVLDDLQALGADYARWRASADARAADASASERRALNATLRRLARVLVPLAYARGERFDHDPAVKLPAVPRLEVAARLATAPPDLKPCIRTGLIRERNKIRAMLRAGRRELA